MHIPEMQKIAAYIIISVFMMTGSAIFLIPVLRGEDPTPYLAVMKEYGTYHMGILMLIIGYLFAQGKRTVGEDEVHE